MNTGLRVHPLERLGISLRSGIQNAKPNKKLLGAAGLAATGYGIYRGMRPSAEQSARTSDYMNNMRYDLNSPMPSMTVQASYEKFANEKLGQIPNRIHPLDLLSAGQISATKSLADTLSQKLIADPIDALHATIKKRFYDEPAWQKNFHETIQSDPELTKIHAENPAMLTDAFASIKRFSPSLAKDRLATKNLLKHVAMSGGELDYSTMKLLAETEKFHNESKRRSP